MPVTPPTSPMDARPYGRWQQRIIDLSPGEVLAICLLLLTAIGLIDHAAGTEIVLTSLNMLPVSVAAWYAGRRWGAVCAMAATVVWLVADVSAGLHYSQPHIYVWNSLMTVGQLLVVAYLVVALRDALHNEWRLARTDYISGALNTRAFYEMLDLEITRANRYKHPLTVVYIDLDNFKTVNDRLGHSAGDQVLRTLAVTLRIALRTGESVARVGGDEFALLLPETALAEANVALERVRHEALAAMDARAWPVTLSLGAVVCSPPIASAEVVMSLADQLMYEAKLAGKNGLNVRALPAPSSTAPPLASP